MVVNVQANFDTINTVLYFIRNELDLVLDLAWSPYSNISLKLVSLENLQFMSGDEDIVIKEEPLMQID